MFILNLLCSCCPRVCFVSIYSLELFLLWHHLPGTLGHIGELLMQTGSSDSSQILNLVSVPLLCWKFLHSVGSSDRYNLCEEFFKFCRFAYSPPRHHQDPQVLLLRTLKMQLSIESKILRLSRNEGRDYQIKTTNTTLSVLTKQESAGTRQLQLLKVVHFETNNLGAYVSRMDSKTFSCSTSDSETCSVRAWSPPTVCKCIWPP